MKPYYTDDLVTLLHGDALEQSSSLDSGSVQTIVTSPPYFGLRDYGEVGQLGAESSVAEYVANMVALFHELRRVLADDGALWLNIGDSYGGGTAIGRNDVGRNFTGGGGNCVGSGNPGKQGTKSAVGTSKNLLGVPWRTAFALQADGWILRSEIIWAKPNPMPESVKDRPTKAHETIFLFSKQPRYFYNADAIAEPTKKGAAGSRFDIGKTHRHGTSTKARIEVDSRNKGTVWTVPTVPFSAAHFAVYPPNLIRPCILAGSRVGDTVLDPFSGSGTTGMVATQEGRKYVGIDLNGDYLDLSLRTRFVQPVLSTA